jgi:hypothetical protein
MPVAGLGLFGNIVWARSDRRGPRLVAEWYFATPRQQRSRPGSGDGALEDRPRFGELLWLMRQRPVIMPPQRRRPGRSLACSISGMLTRVARGRELRRARSTFARRPPRRP